MSSHIKRFLKMVTTVSQLGAVKERDVVENKPADFLDASFGKALNGMPPFLCGGAKLSTGCGKPTSFRGELVAGRASDRKNVGQNDTNLREWRIRSSALESKNPHRKP